MKLKVNFMTSETVDFLMSQEGGANYIVLYQMLCLKTINTDGRLSRTIGEVIIPFDEAKIQRDCKWFSIDTIRVAMELYKKLGLIYEDVDGTLVITEHKGLIGSESESAERVRRFRGKNKPLELPEALHCNADCNAERNKNVTTEIEYRDRDIEIDNIKAITSNKEDAVDDKSNVSVNVQAAASEKPDKQFCIEVGNAWNRTGFVKVRGFKVDSQRGREIAARVSEYGIDGVLTAIEQAGKSEFLHTMENRITLDWFLKAEHFQKVIEGNYLEIWTRRGNERTVDRILRLAKEGAFDEQS